MLDFLTLKPESFGLDISDLSLKIVKLKKRGKFLGLASFCEVKIKPGIINKGEIKDEKTLIKIIQNSLLKVKGEKLRTNYVIASLPEEKAFLQVIQMPKMKKEELKKAIYFEAENYIPFPIDEVYLDSQIVRPFYNHINHFDTLIAALPKKIVDSYISCFKGAGLIPQVLEIESQGISRALIKKGVSPFPILLIDLGASRTSFIIFSGYSLRFTSSVPVSSQKFTEDISKTLKIDLKEARKLKIKYGIKFKDRKIGRKVFEAISPALADLIEQIKKYLNFYEGHTNHEHLSSRRTSIVHDKHNQKRKTHFLGGWSNKNKIKKIFLSGGGANLKGLTEYLSSEFLLPVELGNPWINILPEPLKEVPELSFEESLSYTTALGLALRGIQEK